MFHIALAELMGRRAQKMLTSQVWFGVNQRHRVLQLVAKSECPAGLIKTGAAPKPTAQDLIQQPSVGHQVYRCVGSFHLDRAKRLLPIFPNAFKGGLGGTGFTIAFNQALCVRQVATGSQAKPGLTFLSVRQIKCDLHGPARIQSNPRFTGEALTVQRRRIRQIFRSGLEILSDLRSRFAPNSATSTKATSSEKSVL